MPDLDLDEELTRLRDGVRESLPVPGLDQVIARSRQRITRRRMQIGAVVAVLVVSAAVPLLRNQMVPDPKPASPATNENLMPKLPFLTDVKFADTDHGYAIRTTCKDGKPKRCIDELLATDDGAHWERRAVPKPKAVPSWSPGYLHVLGQDEVTVEWDVSGYGNSRHRLHSVDGGRTWRTVAIPPVVSGAPVSAIPDGGLLAPSCAKLAGGGEQCAERGFAVLLPGSGESAPLSNQPRLSAMVAGEVPTADGRWWVAGRDPKTNEWGLAISDDDGLTWTTTMLDWRESADGYGGWSVVSTGGTLYATVVGPLANVSNGLAGIFRSTDGGATWEQTWRPADDKQPRKVFPSTTASEDGTLTVNSPDGKAYSSHDGGRTFTPGKPRYADYAFWTRTGYISFSYGTHREIVVSADGAHWRKVEIG